MNELIDNDNFFGYAENEDIFGEKIYFTFYFKIKFKIIEEDNKYLLNINYLYKNVIKDLDKNIKEFFLKLFPLNIKEIQSLNIEDFKLYSEYIGEFIVNYCEDDKQFDIFLNKLE